MKPLITFAISLFFFAASSVVMSDEKELRLTINRVQPQPHTPMSTRSAKPGYKTGVQESTPH